MQERSAMQRPLKECSAGAPNEGALNAGALSEAAPSEGALYQRSAQEQRIIWRRAVGRQEGVQFLHAGSRGWSHDQG